MEQNGFVSTTPSWEGGKKDGERREGGREGGGREPAVAGRAEVRGSETVCITWTGGAETVCIAWTGGAETVCIAWTGGAETVCIARHTCSSGGAPQEQERCQLGAFHPPIRNLPRDRHGQGHGHGHGHGHVISCHFRPDRSDAD